MLVRLKVYFAINPFLVVLINAFQSIMVNAHTICKRKLTIYTCTTDKYPAFKWYKHIEWEYSDYS